MRWASEARDVGVTKARPNGTNGKVVARKAASK